MLFCRKTPFSSGVRQSEVLRTQSVVSALLSHPSSFGGAFVLATRCTPLGYEWRLFEIELALRLSMRATRHEHVVLRKVGGYVLRVLLPTEDALNRIYLHPIEYLSFLASCKEKKCGLVTAL